MASTLVIAELVAIGLVSTAFVYVGSAALENSSERLAAYYGLPEVVQGAVVAAVGSSFPELASVVIATLLHGEFDLGVGAIVGSAIFNLLVIPAVSGLVGDELAANRDLVYKEAQFYMVAVSALIIVFAMSVIYYPVPDAAGDLVGEMNRPLAAIPIVLYGLYIFVQFQDTADHESDDAVPDVDPLRRWGILLVSLVVIAGAVEGLVHTALETQAIVGGSTFLWGVVLIAAGTSLPDAIVSVRAARDERGVASIANVLGSNTFDLLIAIPVGVLIAGTANINFGVAVPMMGFLTLATVVVFTFLRTGLQLSIAESYALLAFYGVFLVWMVAETVGAVDVVPGA